MLNYVLAIGLSFLSGSIFAASTCEIRAEAVVGVLDFDVTGCAVTGDMIETSDGITGKFEVDLNKLDAGLDLRTDHMKNKYLEVSKFPSTKMELEKIPYGSKTFKGNLTLHGVTKPVSGDVIEASAGKLVASFKVKITDFGIEKPGYKGIVVGENIGILVSLSK